MVVCQKSVIPSRKASGYCSTQTISICGIKISTTYFAVLRYKTPPSAKIDEKKLPSYAICAKCNNDESYAPSRATIAKIVDFYNSQIRPPVEVYQFTHERLEDSDNIRYRSSSVFDPRFIGTYRGYYPSVTEDVVIGSYLIIFEEDARLKATLIMGLCSDRGNERHPT